jgi:hypothetical protein
MRVDKAGGNEQAVGFDFTPTAGNPGTDLGDHVTRNGDVGLP